MHGAGIRLFLEVLSGFSRYTSVLVRMKQGMCCLAFVFGEDEGRSMTLVKCLIIETTRFASLYLD